MPSRPLPIPALIGDSLAKGVRRGIVRQVRAVFNDTAKGERPVVRSDGRHITASLLRGALAVAAGLFFSFVLSGRWLRMLFRGRIG